MLTKVRSLSFEGVKDSPYYKISSIILSKNEPFTFEEISREVQKELGFNNQKNTIKKSLKKLRNNGLIIEHGSYYSKARN